MWLLPTLTACFLVFLKAILLVFRIHPDSSIYLVLQVLFYDSFLIFLIMLLTAHFERRSVGGVCRIFSALILIWYAIDTSVQIQTGFKLTAATFMKFVSELAVVLTFVNVWHLLILAMICFSHLSFTYVFPPIGLRARALLSTLAICVYALSYTQNQTTRQWWSAARALPIGILGVSSSEASNTYAVQDDNTQSSSRIFINQPEGRPDILVLIVESLSAVHLRQLSYQPKSYVPQLEKIAQGGTLFTNFFANHEITQGALISLLTGRIPMPYPGGSGNLALDFKGFDEIISSFRKIGYYTDYVSSTDLDFRYKRALIQSLQFDSIAERGNVARFENAPRYVFDAPADALLLDEALDRFDRAKAINRPVLMTILTVSTHGPFNDPLGRANTEEAVWDYEDKEIARFYEELKKRDFFSNGVLVILGDHRRLMPMTDLELRCFGTSAVARLPLILVGKGVKAGKIDDRLFQQSDLFAKLDTAIASDQELSPYVYHVDPKLGKLLIFSKEDPREPITEGFFNEDGKLSWSKQPSSQLMNVVQYIEHAQTEAHFHRFGAQSPSPFEQELGMATHISRIDKDRSFIWFASHLTSNTTRASEGLEVSTNLTNLTHDILPGAGNFAFSQDLESPASIDYTFNLPNEASDSKLALELFLTGRVYGKNDYITVEIPALNFSTQVSNFIAYDVPEKVLAIPLPDTNMRELQMRLTLHPTEFSDRVHLSKVLAIVGNLKN